MAEDRAHKRLDCEDHCYFHVGDSFYSGIVKNISLGGALVNFLYPLTVGEICKVSMNGRHNCEYDCEVVRVKTPDVALRFIDLSDAVEH
jgi:hypothetical protein